MATVESYLSQFGIEALPELHVAYDDGRVVLHGDVGPPPLDIRSDYLHVPPTATWDSTGESHNTLIFTDLGPSGFGRKTQGFFFPFIHSMWTDCGDSLESCAREMKTYEQPGNTNVEPNRYTYILFAHPAPLRLHGGPAVAALPPPACNLKAKGDAGDECRGKMMASFKPWMNFSFAELLHDNPGMRPAGLNFMKCNQVGSA